MYSHSGTIINQRGKKPQCSKEDVQTRLFFHKKYHTGSPDNEPGPPR